MTFDQLVADVLSLASQRNVSATVHADHVIVSENDDFISDLRFELTPRGEVLVTPLDDDATANPETGELGERFSDVRDAFEHYDIG